MSDTPKKISTKIWLPVIEKLESKMDAACLRRDAYLNKVLEVELGYLDKEVVLTNSMAAQSFVTDRLNQLDRKSVSLALRPDLVERLNDICIRKRIVRDAYLNRLFLLLAASPKLIDHLLFPSVADEWRQQVWKDHVHYASFFQEGFYPLEQSVDPFWAIRAAIDIYNEGTELYDYNDPESDTAVRVLRDFDGNVSPVESFYTSLLNNAQIEKTDLFGLNCYIPDWQIPGHEANLEHRKRLDDLFLAL